MSDKQPPQATDPRIDVAAQAMTEAVIPNGTGGRNACWPSWDKMPNVAREPWRLYAAAAVAALDRLKGQR